MDITSLSKAAAVVFHRGDNLPEDKQQDVCRHLFSRSEGREVANTLNENNETTDGLLAGDELFTRSSGYSMARQIWRLE